MPASISHRFLHLIINLIAFNVCYLLGNELAHQQAIHRNVAFAFETQIPFTPWMIVPYMSSGLFFGACFFLVKNSDQLRLFSQRMLLATVLASVVFFIYPLQFSGVRPAIDNPVYSTLFGALALMDKPYNQLPSLHVTFCVIFWSTLSRLLTARWARAALSIWLTLTSLATLFTFQHHLLDVVAGLLLGLLCVRVLKPGRTEPHVAFYYGVAALVVLLVGGWAFHSVLAGYLGASLLLVARAYATGDRHFLNKQQGAYAWSTWLFYGPYLCGYWLTWCAVVWRERHKPVIHRLSPTLSIGRRLGAAEARALPLDCTVIDLSNEVTETGALRGRRYHHVPMLDLVPPSPQAVQAVISLLALEAGAGRQVYLHCSMGYSRCRRLAAEFLN